MDLDASGRPVKTGRVIPLSQCNAEQCETLLERYLDKLSQARGFANSAIAEQLGFYIEMITARIDALERREIDAPQEKVAKKPFSGLRIRDRD